MKRFISILISLILCTTAIFAQEYEDDEDVYDDGYVYEQNGAGDRFLKIDLGANFPLNFDKQLWVGPAASVGFYYFINNYVAIGGDVILSYNLSIGNKPLITTPITFGAMVQPTLGKFEFPFMLNVGLASVSCQSNINFPAFAAKATAGAFYRWNETWSFGVSAHGYWIYQWVKDEPEKNDYGLFSSVDLSVRYHF